MTLKNKISIIVSLLFILIFAVSATLIYVLFNDFRRDEFESRLKEKALSSIKLLVEVEQVDRQLLKTIDQNSINKLYDEKTLIFDASYELIYSNLDDTKIVWTLDELKYLKAHQTFFKKAGDYEIFGVYYDSKDKDYFALISAKDYFGKRKLEYLMYILLATYPIFTAITWFFSYQIVKKLLHPLNVLIGKINGINEHNLDTRLSVKTKKDEIDFLANEFNYMLARIDDSYRKQKEFTSNASHELRTPIARITAQLENRIIAEKSTSGNKDFYRNLLNDTNQLSELTHSLLLLSRLEENQLQKKEICRLDELIFDASESVHQLFPEFKIDLQLIQAENLEIKGNKSLLTIAFVNLFKNAYLYSSNKMAKVTIDYKNNHLLAIVANDGIGISEEEKSKMFEPFMRGKNAQGKSGLGLGLRIVKRILNQDQSDIRYHYTESGENLFTIEFPAQT